MFVIKIFFYRKRGLSVLNIDFFLFEIRVRVFTQMCFCFLDKEACLYSRLDFLGIMIFRITKNIIYELN